MPTTGGLAPFLPAPAYIFQTAWSSRPDTSGARVNNWQIHPVFKPSNWSFVRRELSNVRVAAEFEDRNNIGVGVFPEREEVHVGGKRLGRDRRSDLGTGKSASNVSAVRQTTVLLVLRKAVPPGPRMLQDRKSILRICLLQENHV